MGAHLVPLRIYLGVFAALLALTAATVGVAFIDLGAWNTPIALTIAVAKGLLVVLYFMHVRYGRRLTWLFAAAGFLWLAILFLFTFADFRSRDRLAIYGPAYDVELDPGSLHLRPTR